MFELCDIRARHIDQRCVGIDDAVRDERSHAKVVVLHSDALEVSPGEDQRAKVVVDRLQERLGRGMVKAGSAGVLVAPVAVHSDGIFDISFAGAAEGLDGKDVALFHALRGSRLDKGDLLVAVDLVAQDVMAADIPNRFDGDYLSVEFDFIALHDFLDCLADVIDSRIDASFLRVC